MRPHRLEQLLQSLQSDLRIQSLLLHLVVCEVRLVRGRTFELRQPSQVSYLIHVQALLGSVRDLNLEASGVAHEPTC